jgi:alpha-glucosidase (family GH31 glycosyl hydrolase)
MQFDLCASASDEWVLEADLDDEQQIKLHWFEDADPLVIIRQFTMKTGKPALPPLWAFGLWMSANEWNSQARVEKEVRATFEHEITPSVLVIEAWSDETTFYIWNDAHTANRVIRRCATSSRFRLRQMDGQAMVICARKISLILANSRHEED